MPAFDSVYKFSSAPINMRSTRKCGEANNSKHKTLKCIARHAETRRTIARSAKAVDLRLAALLLVPLNPLEGIFPLPVDDEVVQSVLAPRKRLLGCPEAARGPEPEHPNLTQNRLEARIRNIPI